jgi:hypothetical protein
MSHSRDLVVLAAADEAQNGVCVERSEERENKFDRYLQGRSEALDQIVGQRLISGLLYSVAVTLIVSKVS